MIKTQILIHTLILTNYNPSDNKKITLTIFSAEIFPTAIRNSGMGVVSVAARVGGILSPIILMLGDILPNLHFTILGIMTLLAGFLNLKLPETLGQPMPETIADVISLANAGVSKLLQFSLTYLFILSLVKNILRKELRLN